MNWSRWSDRNLVLATLLLLLLEVLWLLMHLQIISNPFKSPKADFSQKPAGFVLKTQHDLRKRGLNSLVWDNAGANDVLYYYDSVLTLSQSTATLHLQEQTEVHLSENTLVTIEPPSSAAEAQIRLKFTRGDLRARNPSANAKIEASEWSLNLTQGSEVSLHQTGREDFEVEVLKGNLEFEKDQTKKALTENQVLKINGNQAPETLAVAGDLKFQGPEYQRIYTLQRETPVALAWSGEADQLQIRPLGKEPSLRALDSAQKQASLPLSPGKYTLRLMKKGQVSEAKEIEIWAAPTLHLLSPFPRDRVRTFENISFVWSFMPEATEYKLILTDTRHGQSIEKKVQDNALEFHFGEESDWQWQVIGIDAEGFEIPSMDSNLLFPRHEPLAAPKLKSPELRRPASPQPHPPDSSNSPKSLHPLAQLLWSWGLSAARAESDSKADYEAVFAWEEVPGADLYNIEISDSPDFHHPRISKTVHRTEFVWSHFSLGTYYWRVAAGSSSGRMGVFSEPAKVQLDQLPENSAQADGVLIRKKLTAEKQRTPVTTKTEDIFQQAPLSTFEEKRFDKPTPLVRDESRELKETYLFEWTPQQTSWNLSGEDQLQAKLNGSSTGAAHFQSEQMISKEQSYFVDFSYAQYKWQARDLSQYPFQEDQSVVDFSAQILFGNDRSRLLRGGVLQSVPWIERKGLEKIEIHSALALGPSIQYLWPHGEDWKSSHTLSFVAGSQVFALSNQNRFRYLFYQGEQTKGSIGFHFQEDLIFFKSRTSSGWSAGLSLGFEH